MSVDRWTLVFILAVIATGLWSWHAFKSYQVSACIDGGGHWDKSHSKCRDRPINRS